MKKLFTLIVAAFMAVSVNAQTETPLVLGGDWNAGFAGDADVYDFTINKQYGAAEFACNVNSQIILSISSSSKNRFLPTSR